MIDSSAGSAGHFVNRNHTGADSVRERGREKIINLGRKLFFIISVSYSTSALNLLGSFKFYYNRIDNSFCQCGFSEVADPSGRGEQSDRSNYQAYSIDRLEMLIESTEPEETMRACTMRQ